MAQKVEMNVMPVISTGHIDKETAEALDAGCDWCAQAKFEGYGYFLYLDDLECGATPAPQCLVDIRDWLRSTFGAENQNWVRLDRDAQSVDGLRTYDW